MPDNEKKGTGAELCRIKFGSEIGRIIFYDDGDDDLCVKAEVVEEPWGNKEKMSYTNSLCETIQRARSHHGDEAVSRALSGEIGDSSLGPSSGWIGQASFRCDECNDTKAYNEEHCPDPNEKVCADCTED